MLFVTPWMLDGGIERTIEVKVPWLAGRGHRTEVTAWRVAETLAGSPNPTLAALAAAGVPFHPLPPPGRLGLVGTARRVAARARHARADVVIGHELRANVVVLLAKVLTAGRLRAIVQTHNEPATYRATGASARLLQMGRALYRLADGAVAVSDYLRRAHLEVFGGDPDRVVTIHNPMEIGRIAAAAHTPIGAPEGAPFIVACGRLTAVKGFDDLIRAFALVRQRHRLRLVILGDGPDRAALLRTAREAGVEEEIDLPGFVANPFAWFGRARCFVLSSRSEGLANVLLEAMAAGAPIVSSRCGGAEEVVEHGRTGLLYPPGDVEALARALGTVVEDPGRAGALALGARKRVQDFAEERILPRLERYYLHPSSAAALCSTASLSGSTVQFTE